MRKLFGVAILLSLTLLIQACAPVGTLFGGSEDAGEASCGFVRNSYGERVSWQATVPATLYVHESVPDEYLGAIVAAAETWNKSIGRRLLIINTTERVGGPVNPHRDGKNIIYMMSTWEPNLSSQQARTSVYWVGDQLQEADVRINSKYSFYWNGGFNPQAINIEALMLHELGHVLGFEHNDTGGSVMATTLPAGSNRTQLGSKDSQDLKCEY